MQGADPAGQRVTARFTDDYRKVEGRAEAIRVGLEAGEGGWSATPTGRRARTCSPRCSAPTVWRSHPTELDVVRAGEPIEVELLR